MIEQFYLTHRRYPNRSYPIQDRVYMRVIAMKEYFTFPEAQELEPHHQMQFSVILSTLVLFDPKIGP